MSPRNRTIQDDVVIQAAWRAILQRGTANVRIADVAAESGLAAATLIKRFGTRDAPLDAVADMLIAQLRHSRLDSIAISDHLRFFIAHPAKSPAYATAFRARIGGHLAEMVEAGELPPHDIAYMADRIHTYLFGVATSHVLALSRSHVPELAQLLPYLFSAFETGGSEYEQP